MGWLGLKIAKLFGEKLPTFANQAEAEARLFKERDKRLQRVVQAAKSSECFVANFAPESLKQLEEWYFQLWESRDFERVGVPREEFERWMGMYFCEVLVRNCADARWEVRVYAFQTGKYEIGVQRGLTHLMRSRFTNHYKATSNKRRQKIFREYEQYAS